MNYYMLLLRSETINFSAYSPEDFQKILADFDQWNASMIREERLIASGNLQSKDTKIIRPGNVVKDGPYSEAKEAVAGFLLIKAEDATKAAAIASGCPFLSRGGSVEVRQIPQLEFEDAARPIMEEHAHARASKAQAGKEA